MLVLLSPAKTLDFTSMVPDQIPVSMLYFPEEVKQLAQILKTYSAKDLANLMKLSPKLSELNYQRFQEFESSDSRPAIYAYNGDVYEGFELSEYDSKAREFANKTLCIISGLYGILKPFDLIKPYRLEMSTNLKNPFGKNLYDLWGDKLTDKLNSISGEFIINLASQEYSLAINPAKLNKKKIDIIFKDNGKVIGLFSKKARSIMANFIIRNEIVKPDKLKQFTMNGYKYMPSLSSEVEYVFVR